VARLTKRDVEQLLATYDDDPVGALTVALRRLVATADPSAPGASWPQLVAIAIDDPQRRASLLAADVDALDDLARELIERRGLDR
jgi:hypothetical protein